MKCFVNDGCIGCGLCAGTCPEVFSMSDAGSRLLLKQKYRKELSTVLRKPRTDARSERLRKHKEDNMRKHVKGNVSWVGYIDWELESFHGDDYSIMNGSSQNAYLIEEEKTVLIDTIWTPHRFDFIENLKKEVDLHKIDFIVANHGECDHSL